MRSPIPTPRSEVIARPPAAQRAGRAAPQELAPQLASAPAAVGAAVPDAGAVALAGARAGAWAEQLAAPPEVPAGALCPGRAPQLAAPPADAAGIAAPPCPEQLAAPALDWVAGMVPALACVAGVAHPVTEIPNAVMAIASIVVFVCMVLLLRRDETPATTSVREAVGALHAARDLCAGGRPRAPGRLSSRRA
jgi:hypothetical protein